MGDLQVLLTFKRGSSYIQKNKEMLVWTIPKAPLEGLAHHPSFLSSSAAINVREERKG